MTSKSTVDIPALQAVLDQLQRDLNAMHDKRVDLLRTFGADPSKTNSAALRKADDDIATRTAEAKLFQDALTDAMEQKALTAAAARIAASAATRQRAAEGARDLAKLGKVIDDAVDALRQAFQALSTAGEAVRRDVVEAVEQLVPGLDQRIDVFQLLLPRAGGAGPEAAKAIAGIAAQITRATEANLTDFIQINDFARLGGTMARALEKDAALIASRLNVKLEAKP